MKCPNCNAEVLFTKDGQCAKCEHLPKKKIPKKRTRYHRDYQKKIMADPVRREKYLKYQREHHRARKAAEVEA